MAQSSSSRKDRKPYHHGGLREALVAAGVQLVRQGGAGALTLRAVAGAAGVSQTAPYRHFKDRRALVAAIAEDGFRRMGDAIGLAVQDGAGGLAALQRGMRAYVNFAHANPAQYRIMFGPEVAHRGNLIGLDDTALSVFGILRDGIERLQQRGALLGSSSTTMAMAAWATLHGLAMLSLDGQIAATGHGADSVIEGSIALLLAGMTSASTRVGND